MFLANYSDGLTDAFPLPDMINRFKKSGKIACFHSHTPADHLSSADFDENGVVRRMSASQDPRYGSMAGISFSGRRYSTTFKKGTSW